MGLFCGMYALLTIFAFKDQNRWAWNCIAIADPIWVVVDSVASIPAGVYLEAVFNLVFLIAVMIPLIKTYRFFYAKSDSLIEAKQNGELL